MNRSSPWPFVLLLLSACTGGEASVDAGPKDASLGACASSFDCRTLGVEAACRHGSCLGDVPCEDDSECQLGERCVAGQCLFSGCASDADCAVGRCRLDTFQCTECGSAGDCPAERPACTDDGRCVGCQADVDCQAPGPGYCDAASGTCRHCREDAHCPTGLFCESDGRCRGAAEGQACGVGRSCDLGLLCVTLNGADQCLRSCSVYSPQCRAGEICLTLPYPRSGTLLFDRGEPLGICFQPLGGLRNLREACSNDNCQPNLECIPDSPTTRTCKAFCNPQQPICASGEVCNPFTGDALGHRYGLCFQDNGFGQACAREADCRPGLSCAAAVDPAETNGLGSACRFSLVQPDGGPAKAPLSPCAVDGDCRSGACRVDPVHGSPRACFARCGSDADCDFGDSRGTCDGTFSLTARGKTSTFQGCRVSCDAPARCAQFGPDYSCGLRLEALPAPATTSIARQRCVQRTGSAPAGASCVNNADCAEGFCRRVDGRGQARHGLCVHPCVSGSDCAADGGSPLEVACERTPLFLNGGADMQAGTLDDVLSQHSLCTAPACAQSADCPPQAPHCSVEELAEGALVLRCQPSSTTGGGLGGAPCTADGQCRSGVCAGLTTGTGSVCFEPCTVGVTVCPAATSCQAAAVSVRGRDGAAQSFSACAP